MTISVYARMAAARAELDWRKNTDLLATIENTPLSQHYTQSFQQANFGGISAFEMKVPHITVSGVVDLEGSGYSTAGSYGAAAMDPSAVTYSKQTDTTLTPRVDTIALCHTRIAEMEADMHALGRESLLALAADGARDRIRGEMTKHLIATVEAAGQNESAATPFQVTISTEATFKTDFDEVIAARNAQDGGNYANWIMVLPSVYEGTLSMYDFNSNQNYIASSGTPDSSGVVSGRVYRMFGMPVMFSNHFADNDSGFLVSLDRVAMVTPFPIRVRDFRDKATPLSDFYAFYKMWGCFLTGHQINNYDGSADATNKEGCIALSLS